MLKGLFISFEGSEGSGKTTQIKKLELYLKKKKKKYIITYEPGGTVISDRIREILMNPIHKDMIPLTELFLYTASRAQHVEELIIPALNEGKTVICDRFSDSMIAYQCFARKISRRLVDNLNNLSTGGLKPDLTFLLNIPVDIGLLRAKKIQKRFSKGEGDRLEQEELEFHKNVIKGYRKIALRNPRRVKVIDGLAGIEEIFEEIKEIVDEKFQELNVR
ncbi:MAG: dTMP kinase [Candidatus Firestonebacteria bacterium]|nr:dTMP kinase [Candidatus Firestonebacteria bacterium]